MSKRALALKQERHDRAERARALHAAAENEGRDLTEQERVEFDAIMARLPEIDGELDRIRSLALLEPAVTAAWDTSPVRAEATERQVWEAGQPRFRSLGEQLQAVAAATSGDRFDPRLVQVGAASGLSEGLSSDGGFLLQTDFVQTIMQRVYDQGEIVRRCRPQPIGANANGVKIPGIDETSRVNGSRWGGVRAYWAAEAATVTATQPKFRLVELSLKKLMALVYSTNELLADSTALEAWIMETVPLELVFALEDAIMSGDGVGKPLGILTSANPALVTQAAEGGQTAATFNASNAAKMRARLPARSRASAIWTMNQDVEPQLPLMTLANQPVFTPDFRQAPGGVLLGHDVVPTEYNSTIGALYDVALIDFSQYYLATKGSIRQDVSLHVRFIFDEALFRFTWRVDGQPAWHSPLTPFKGSSTQSPYVTLAAR